MWLLAGTELWWIIANENIKPMGRTGSALSGHFCFFNLNS